MKRSSAVPKQTPVSIVADQLFWISDQKPPRNKKDAFFFCIDDDLVHEPFFRDFGPLNLGQTYRFVTELEKLMSDPQYNSSRIYHYTSLDPAKRANSAFLMGAFMVIILKKSADEAWAKFKDLQPGFKPFRDATFGECTYKCTILDCLRGLEYAIKLGWFDIENFNLRDYEFYERVENGDFNWVLPGKFVAFSGPSKTNRDPDGWRTFTPEDYVPIFKQLGVKLVIRLNRPQYEAERFKDNGLDHLDLFFEDGTCPDTRIYNAFLEATERELGAVAVHCKAGLGRTGTLIGMYAMKHHRFPAAAWIGWIRIARPGSILGPQQQFLNRVEQMCFDWGDKMRAEDITKAMDVLTIKPERDERGGYSPQDKKIAKHGQKGQGEFLMSMNRKRKV